jgi:hypothetical protein
LSMKMFELLLDGIILGRRKRRAVETMHDVARESRIVEP